ncbi:MAG TPA: hypothetical protein VM451_09230 [Candidatus Limnocylindria bacterium]|nr:hypothetical protein [Candidatus Limnocylindria bacterium]
MVALATASSGSTPATPSGLEAREVAGSLLAIMIGGSVARWDETLAAAEPGLESVTIGE